MLSLQSRSPLYFSYKPYYNEINKELNFAESQINHDEIPKIVEFIKSHPGNRASRL